MMTKERALMVLRRRTNHLTRTEPDHVAMAARGLSYAERMEVERKAAEAAADAAIELEALTMVMDFFRDNYTEEKGS